MQGHLLDEDLSDEEKGSKCTKLTKSSSGRRALDRDYLKVIGNNFKTARKLSNYTTKEVMRKIWGSDVTSNNLNRISEIENGLLAPSISVIAQLAQLYGCSLDYIFGFSPEYEIDLSASHTGYLATAMSEVTRDMGEQIARALMKLTDRLPRSEGQDLLDSAKKVVHQFERANHDLVFLSHYKDYVEAFSELRDKIISMDARMARHMRLVDMTFDQALEAEQQRLLMEIKKYPKPLSLHDIDSLEE